MAEEEKKKEKVDERLEFLWNYIMKTMRLKQEKWNKMLATTEYKVNYKELFFKFDFSSKGKRKFLIMRIINKQLKAITSLFL